MIIIHGNGNEVSSQGLRRCLLRPPTANSRPSLSFSPAVAVNHNRNRGETRRNESGQTPGGAGGDLATPYARTHARTPLCQPRGPARAPAQAECSAPLRRLALARAFLHSRYRDSDRAIEARSHTFLYVTVGRKMLTHALREYRSSLSPIKTLSQSPADARLVVLFSNYE